MVFCVVVQVAAIGLAILSRIHFSKYKVWIRYVVVILLVSSVCAQVLYVREQSGGADRQAVLPRADYDGEARTEDIQLSIDDKEYSYAMEIEPREYTEEEFYRLAEKQGNDLEAAILGKNPDPEHVTEDLDLPDEDADGVFTYTWWSDRPDIVTSYGKVYLEEIKDHEVVILSLEVSYSTYKYERDFPLVVVQQMRRKDAIENVQEMLLRLEQETRTDSRVTLPDTYENVKIRVREKGMRPSVQCLFLGIMLAGAVFTVLYSRNREQQKKDNDALIRDYPFLVNRLWLLLGTGMTVQMGIRQIMSELNDNVCLKRELEYAIHCLQTGGEESLVYEQLGRRLKLPEYNRLFRQLGQHVRIGTKDLRNLMELEMQTALKKRRELAKKKGEEASTKLLFPMIVLLALVMVLIVYPAMTGL